MFVYYYGQFHQYDVTGADGKIQKGVELLTPGFDHPLAKVFTSRPMIIQQDEDAKVVVAGKETEIGFAANVLSTSDMPRAVAMVGDKVETGAVSTAHTRSAAEIEAENRRRILHDEGCGCGAH